MANYLIRRLSYGVLVLLTLVTAIFLLMNVIGDPVALMFPEWVPEEALIAKREELGYLDPVHVQYFRFISNGARGDFGVSTWQRVPAMGLVLDRLDATLLLASVTIAIAALVGVALGLVAAYRPDGLLDRTATVLSMGSIAVPEFWFALLLIVVFAVQLDLLPTSGYGSWNHMILPVVALVLKPIGRIGQMTRSSMSDQLRANYVVTAKAKGLEPRTILVVHMLKNAAIAIITLIGDEIVSLVNGAIVVETVFAWPGIGLLLIEAIKRRDLPVVEATVATIGVMVILINLAVDLSYGFLDPRIRYK